MLAFGRVLGLGILPCF